ncbi:MAG: transcription-repair coupling factor [Deltaproteobacteria bacterium]|nr:transcription-repair coupling factor [Deltaproteobacteria bacterium]
MSQLLTHLGAGAQAVALRGAGRSQLALLIAQLSAAGELPRPLLVLTPDEDGARETVRDLTFFLGADLDDPAMELPRVLHLPDIETSPYAEISPDRAATMARLGVLFRLTQGRPPEVVVASAAALRRRVLPRRGFVELCDLVVAEEEFDRESLAARLVAAGYLPARVVEDPGTFAVRGGILDLFPPLHRYPARLEFYGDLVESIRLFEPATQRTLRSVKEVMLHPVRETVRSGETDVKARILAAADAASFPSRATRTILEEVESGREFFGIDALTPAFHERLDALSAYLPAEALWVVHEPERIVAQLEAEEERARAAYEARLADGRLAFPPEDFFVRAEELAAELGRVRRVVVQVADEPGLPTVEVFAASNADVVAELQRTRADRGEEILKSLASRVRAWLEEGLPVVIGAGPPAHVERLETLLRGYNLGARTRLEPGTPELLGTGSPPPGLTLQVGELGSGFRLPNGLVLLSEEEIFGPRAPRRPARRVSAAGLGDLRELKLGDHVVHAVHGIGCYRGLMKLQVEGVPSDFLLLEYAGGDKLYLPVYRMDQVQRFIGAEGEVRLDKLGGQTWLKKKSKVAAEVRKLGEELLQLYAQRQALTGFAFPTPDASYAEFEATFPYTETPDQLEAIHDVLKDLAAERPMDRLVCGDVGFGKTEVALRAAFWAASEGKQVAVLAPTTVLVEQHHRTFAERMASYPFRVERVSRFRKADELRQVLADLAAGKVDIVIGTHRLLSTDVRFKDLGLLVVDEEQRFGVTHKERIKKLRSQVDVLTLTATPIPRTLQMSMVGLREISLIATPPVDRLAIRTFVCRYDDALVREAMQRELDRGGQIFFVHNRVEDIGDWAGRVGSLLPDARVCIGHGQMEAGRLEQVMLDFVEGRYDVLVCTTIIESGLDIPRANTMFVNHADRFGLAQLYQIRGRIGRGKQRAFCYLLVPGIEKLTDEARKRLEVLQQFTQLGSGFSIASHDLEIRGAGDLLGARQSGQIGLVGFETYARILEEAVAELKGEPIHRESDPEINARVAAFIPDDYVEDTGQRLELYQRLSSSARDEQEVAEILVEIQDRYGPRPDEVDALGDLMVVKGMAARLKATVVDLTATRLTLSLDEATPLDPQAVMKLVSNKQSGFRLTPQMKLIRELGPEEQGQPLHAGKKVLRELLAHAKQLHQT